MHPALKPDLVLLDMQFPDMDGFAVLTALAEVEPPPDCSGRAGLLDKSAHNCQHAPWVAEAIMLAAESAWRVLRAEHCRMRELLSSIDEALQSDRWRRPGRSLLSLRQLVQSLQSFNDSTHRPKGVVLLAALRGRSSEADDLLDRLELTGHQCDRLLSQALALLDHLERGDDHAAAQCASVLEQHRDLMQSHLDEEDTLLHSHTARLLTPEEWSQIVSSISSVVQSTGVRVGP